MGLGVVESALAVARGVGDAVALAEGDAGT